MLHSEANRSSSRVTETGHIHGGRTLFVNVLPYPRPVPISVLTVMLGQNKVTGNDVREGDVRRDSVDIEREFKKR